MKSKKVQQLLSKYREGNCTDEEKVMLECWAHHLNEYGDPGLTETDFMEAEDEMWAKIKPQKQSVLGRMYWPSVAAALLVFCLLGVMVKSYLDKKGAKYAPVIADVNKVKIGGNKAILTLANGKKIVLSDAVNGKIAQQGNIRISKTADGQLVYTVAGSAENAAGKLAYNTIETPRGGQYQINLPDGSKVWLNAASSLRFPVRFNGDKRQVELSGEGYFEIKHIEPVKGESVPFLVKTVLHMADRGGQTVEVLGTHFNINAYSDESAIKTTLLEGSVRVTASAVAGADKQTLGFKLLKPGQQSVLNSNELTVVKADTEAAIAWKNGSFRFNDESLESIMRKVSKWYDVDVIYQNEKLKTETFSGFTTRFANVSELLKTLELTDVVRFKIEGNKIIVTDKSTN